MVSTYYISCIRFTVAATEYSVLVVHEAYSARVEHCSSHLVKWNNPSISGQLVNSLKCKSSKHIMMILANESFGFKSF